MDTNNKKFAVVERAVTWLLIMLIAEFVLGVLLTTLFDHENPGLLRTSILVAHIAVGVGLLVGSLGHIFTSRSSHLLGIKPVLGFLCIVGAFLSGVATTVEHSELAVLAMSLFFGAAIVVYGLSFAAVKAAGR